MLDFNVDHPDDATEWDIKSFYSPMQYDQNITAVDYFFEQEGDYFYTYVVASTPYNVYEIVEQRDLAHGDPYFTIKEIVTGTFMSEVVALSFPENTDTYKEIFTIAVNGLIKKLDDTGWNLKGLAFEGEGNWTGTDISLEFLGGNELIMASATKDNIGMIMFSPNGGETWEERSPLPLPEITTVGFDSRIGFDNVYAAGKSDFVWKSTNNGLIWSEIGEFVDPDFKDILHDPGHETDPKVHVCGSVGPKAAWYDGDEWHNNESGLEGVETVNQLSNRINSDLIYAATDNGIYEKNMFYPNESIWEQRCVGIGVLDMVSIANDPADNEIFISATNSAGPNLEDPAVYVTVNSGQSWVNVTNGAINQDRPLIYRVAASNGLKRGFVVGTSNGIYYLDDIIKTGTINTQTWGPGNIIVKDRVTLEAYNDLTIVPPCTVYIDYFPAAVIRLGTESSLDAVGYPDDQILFTSTAPQVTWEYWDGIQLYYLGDQSVQLENCIFEHAKYCIVGFSRCSTRDFTVSDCKFIDIWPNGQSINIYHPPSNGLVIRASEFEGGGYGIRIRNDSYLDYPSIEISNNSFLNCDYGISYSGNSNLSGEKQLNISNNTFTQEPPYEGNYAVHITKFNENDPSPIVNITSNRISYFDEGGIYLNSVSSSSKVEGNKVERNGSVGIHLIDSSPNLDRTEGQEYNCFNYSSTGIKCEGNSHPTVRWTQFKENTYYGADIESSEPCDFGDFLEWGNNSFHTELHPHSGYRDMRNTNPDPDVEVLAEGNWWGEYWPDEEEIEGYIDYSFPLEEDPLPGLGKRNAGSVSLPERLILTQNFPNPFNPRTSISLYLEKSAHASLKVYNLCGQLVNTLIEDRLESGNHTVVWDGKNEIGKDVSSGIYFYVLTTDFGKTIKKMTLLR
jgi:parallel beta-helix repeat protein